MRQVSPRDRRTAAAIYEAGQPKRQENSCSNLGGRSAKETGEQLQQSVRQVRPIVTGEQLQQSGRQLSPRDRIAIAATCWAVELKDTREQLQLLTPGQLKGDR